ncbi:hypothetical protein [Nocardioides xinjiangensis]|nr:hypothetical protein [Nocardioides sp. SYSU D00514]
MERLQILIAETMHSETIRRRAAEAAAEMAAQPELSLAMLDGT